MLGRFVWVRVRVITAAPLPGVSAPRFVSRGAIRRAGADAEAPNAGLNHRAKRAIPARKRTTNGLEAVGTKTTPFLTGLTQTLTHPNTTLCRCQASPARGAQQKKHCQFGGRAQEARSGDQANCRPGGVPRFALRTQHRSG